MATPQIAFLDIGTPELIIILFILLLLFGSKKLPQLTRSMGESMKELRKGMSDHENSPPGQNNENKDTNTAAQKSSPQA